MSAERQTSNGVKNKAFIFDMDGVLVNSEPVWEEQERERFPAIFGADVTAKMPNLIGAGLGRVFELAESLGAVFDRKEAEAMYEIIAHEVYTRSPLTDGIHELAESLLGSGFKLGLVTQSKQSWMDQVVPRLPFKDKLQVILSLHEHPELKRKPAPDGYIDALRQLDADPKLSFVLEDSNYGIEAGKAAGCYVIGYRGNLVDGYDQHGADCYADTMQEVAEIVQKRTTRQ